MRTAESWVSVISPAAHLGVAGELERQIKRIQRDAMMEAAEIANQSIAHELDCDWVESKNQKPCSCGIGMITTGIYDAILARAKEVEAKPHSTDEKKINPL